MAKCRKTEKNDWKILSNKQYSWQWKKSVQHNTKMNDAVDYVDAIKEEEAKKTATNLYGDGPP